MLSYQRQNSSATVREGIVELREAEADDMAGDVLPELADEMDPHDAVHVVFACGTDLMGEVQAHLWMLLATTARMADMHRTTKTNDHRAALEQIGHRQLLSVWLRAIPTALVIAYRALRMKRRWPLGDCQEFLDRPLVDIRTEYGIRLPG